VAVWIGATFASYLLSQAIHVVAYEKNDARFTDITRQLPFYYPITSHRNASKYASLLPMIAEDSTRVESVASLAYPAYDVELAASAVQRRPNILMLVLESWRFDCMNEVVSPSIHALSLRGSNFENHFSSGNSTPSGVFSLFYGIHPTYWGAVKANSAAIHNPVLIDVMEANGYQFGIFADSHFQRHKIKDGMFRGIEVQESFAGSTPDANDRDLTQRLLAFAVEQDSLGKPFFAFAFYKSTHFSYYYPKDSARFTPARKLNIALAGTKSDPTAFLNDYRNAIHYVDGLVGLLVEELEARNILENTIVIVTSDHGEEFNDNKANYWGHTSNFTGFQTRVPMVVYVPWREPRRVTDVTAHIDIPPTILEEGLGWRRPVADYSNGRNLFGPARGDRAIVVASYVNHAVITGDDVYSVYPMYVQKYKLWDINEKAAAPRTDLARSAMAEMHRFYAK
jgi:membrane-anchored protein YejM (alkaline phosphatase superfamily)